MKEMFRFVLAVLLGLVGVLPGIATAQEDEWMCDDDLLAAAQATYDEAIDLKDQARVDKLKEAYWLAAQGEALCTAEPDRFRDAQRLRQSVDISLRGTFDLPLDVEPGKVDLGDFGLFMICAGEGSPTVIFENGFGIDALYAWDDIQPAISTVTRACRYDRRNVGLSQPYARLDRDAVRTVQDQVDDLVLLLETTGIEPPYVLVGHSWGGLIALLFTDQHPDWVQGIVLVDASHPDQEQGFNLAGPPQDLEALTPDHPQNNEHLDIQASVAQVAPIRRIGDRQLVILTALKGRDVEAQAVWNRLQADYVTFSSNSHHILLENNDQCIPCSEELNLVIEAIVWMLDEVRAEEE